MDSILLTPAALLEFLVRIDEFSDLEVGVNPTIDGNIEVIIGESIYMLDCSSAVEVEVDQEVVEVIDDVNEEAYDAIEDEFSGSINDYEDVDVEGGILKEIAKTFLVGGAVRLAGGIVKDVLK